jgi:polyisoprenoid-binding protein YceI
MKIQNKIILLSAGVVLAGLFSFKVFSSAWKVNQTAAKISWVVQDGRHAGTISELDAMIDFDPSQLEKGIIKATVEASSIDANNEKLNAHLEGPEYFNAEKHPKITFTSDSISRNDSGFVATGKLAIRDSVRTVSVPFRIINGEKESTIKGTMDIMASDYGLMKRSATGTDRVIITIEVPVTKE